MPKNKSNFILMLLAALCLLPFSLTHAETDEERYEAGNKAYEAGDFEKAVKEYELLAQAGSRNPNVYYNLGNAWYRQGEKGRAILNYERALVLSPEHPEAIANLKYVQKVVNAMVAPTPWYMIGVEKIGTDRLPWLASGFFWAAAFLVVFAIFRIGNRRALWTTTSVLCFCMAGVFSAGLWVYASREGVSDAAIVVSPKVNAKSGPYETAGENGSIPMGTRVRVLNKRNDWVYVELPDQKTRGFVPTGAVETIRN